MFRRCMIALGLMMAVTVLGCGSMMLVRYGEPIWLPDRVSRNLEVPSQRLALATLDVLSAELAEVNADDFTITVTHQFDKPDGTTPAPGETALPEQSHYFWLDGVNPGRPAIVEMFSCEFHGKNRLGRAVEAVVRVRAEGPTNQSVLSLQVDGDRSKQATNALIEKIAERVAHPTLKPGSAEEMQALFKLSRQEPKVLSRQPRPLIKFRETSR